MLAADTLKNFMFLLKSFLFTERAPVMKLTCSTFQPARCITPLKRCGGTRTGPPLRVSL